MNLPQVIAHDETSPGELVYAELNLEKWPIWEPSSAKKQPRSRVFKRERVLADGSRVTASVEIEPTTRGPLSTRDQKVYYVLLKMWDDAGRPNTRLAFSLQGIARLLGEGWSKHAHQAICQSLLRLRGVLFVWQNSYFDKTTGEHLELLDTFNILSRLKIARRSRGLHATTGMCEFQFHEQLLKSLHANYTTPLFLDTVLGFRSEIAQILYPRLDLFLADKNKYERRTRELFEDLGLEAETYRHRSARKRVLELALLELQGVPLTTGRIASVVVEPTKDNLDFKLVVHKGPSRKPGRPRKVLTSTCDPFSAAQEPSAPSTRAAPGGRPPEALAPPLATEPSLLVGYFHHVFHGASLTVPSPKEALQAAHLLEAHGLAKAKALVDFARAEADKTKYSPASLNGILQYQGRFETQCEEYALAEERRQILEDQQRQARDSQERQHREVASALLERVGLVKEAAPEAFAAFHHHIEAERAKFMGTPIARRASPETRELLSREYERPIKRLEMFVGFFQLGGQGESLLRAHPRAYEIPDWLRAYGEVVQHAIRHDNLSLSPPPIWS